MNTYLYTFEGPGDHSVGCVYFRLVAENSTTGWGWRPTDQISRWKKMTTLWMRTRGRAFESWALLSPLPGTYLPTLHHHLSFTVSSSHLWFILLTVAFFFLCLAGRDHPVFCALVNGEGEVTDFLRLPHFTKRRTAWREEEREKKVSRVSRVGLSALCTSVRSSVVF